MLDATALNQAEAQYGVIARFQLTERLPGGAVDAALAGGQVARVHRGVYRIRGAPCTPEQTMVAACLRARPRATVTGPAVLGQLRLDGFAPEGPYEVVRRPGRRLACGAFAHREDQDPTRRVRRVGAAQFAVPVDAYLESAPHLEDLGERAFRHAYDRLRFRSGVTEVMLRRRARALLPGVAEIADLLALLEMDGLAVESEGERRLGRHLARFSPAPEAQVWLATGHRVDWYFRDLRVAIEYQGRLDHTGVRNREADEERRVALDRLGVVVHPVTHEDLDRPEAFIAVLAGLLAVRAAKLGVPAPRLR
jgi:hypothetical protein